MTKRQDTLRAHGALIAAMLVVGCQGILGIEDWTAKSRSDTQDAGASGATGVDAATGDDMNGGAGVGVAGGGRTGGGGRPSSSLPSDGGNPGSGGHASPGDSNANGGTSGAPPSDAGDDGNGGKDAGVGTSGAGGVAASGGASGTAGMSSGGSGGTMSAGGMGGVKPTGGTGGKSASGGASACTDQSGCAPRSTKVCGGTGTATCNMMCAYDPCVCPAGKSLCGSACVDESTDSSNCGGCGLVCNSGCNDGRCITVVGSVQYGTSISALKIKGSIAYYSERDGTGGYLYGFDFSTGKTSTVMAADEINAFTFDASSVYATNSGPGHTGTYSRIIKSPPNDTVLARIPAVSPEGIAVDATNVYYAASDGTVMKLPVGGGTPNQVCSGLTSPTELAIDSFNAYFFDSASPGMKIDKVILTGGTAVTLTKTAAATGLSVVGGFIYWATSDTVFRLSVAGGTPTPIASGQTFSTPIVVDGTSVYWVDSTNNLLKEPVAGGGTPEVVATIHAEKAIAVDSTSVYWIDSATATIAAGPFMKLTPK